MNTIVTQEEKICKKCNKVKTIDMFSINGKYIKNICKECINEYSKTRYIDKIDIISNQHNDYYYNNKEKILLNQRQWYSKNKGNALLKKIIRKRRIEKVSDGTITYSAINEKLILQNYKCNYCGCNIENIEKHLDHIHPLSKGGLHTISNVQWTCSHCNLSKGAKTHNKFLTIIKNGKGYR